MTVSELIEMLYKCDGDAVVYIPCPTGGDMPVNYVEEGEDSWKVYLS